MTGMKEMPMHINVNKTKTMLIATTQRQSRLGNPNLDLNVGETSIENVSSHKVLGVHVDKFLQWEVQIDQVHNMINSKIILLSKIKKYLPTEIRILYFNAYILPLFDYCITIWGNCSRSNVNRLLKLQKKAARIILSKTSDAASKPLFKELKWLDIEKRITIKKVSWYTNA